MELALFNYVHLLRSIPFSLVSLTFYFGSYISFLSLAEVKVDRSFNRAFFTTIGWIISSLGFSYYVNNFNNYSVVYGSIGVIIVLMIWFYITSIIILLGGELNAILSHEKRLKGKWSIK